MGVKIPDQILKGFSFQTGEVVALASAEPQWLKRWVEADILKPVAGTRGRGTGAPMRFSVWETLKAAILAELARRNVSIAALAQIGRALAQGPEGGWAAEFPYAKAASRAAAGFNSWLVIAWRIENGQAVYSVGETHAPKGDPAIKIGNLPLDDFRGAIFLNLKELWKPIFDELPEAGDDQWTPEAKRQ